MARSNASEAGAPGEQGYALLIVLWTMVMLALLSAQVVGGARAELQDAAATRETAQLEGAADAAIWETIWHMIDGSGDYWAPGAASYTLKEAAGPVEVEIEDDRGKLDLNQMPAAMFSGLFSVLGADDVTARALGTAIVDWRTQNSPGDQDDNVSPEYRMDGRVWGPPGQEFDRMEDLLLVRGMTPDLYQAAVPYLTLNLEQAPWTQYTGPVVAAALAKAKRFSGVFVSTPNVKGPIVLRLVATANGPNGARFVRRVMMRFDGTLSGAAWKYRIFTWDQG
jgi:general secretion pathway protein K